MAMIGPRKWPEEKGKLRAILLDRGLTETRKWGKPCFTHDGRNIAIVQEFKEFCTLLFFQGALLQDAKKLLRKPGENTQAGRWIQFTSVAEIEALEPVLKAYIDAAIAIEKAGLKVQLKKPGELVLPGELEQKFKEVSGLKKAFASLTPGRQRAYVLYFSAPKQAKTRESRVEKWVEPILQGKGWNEGQRNAASGRVKESQATVKAHA